MDLNYLGIDIGGTSVKMGIVNGHGKISHASSYDVAFDDYDTPILDTVLNCIDRFLDGLSMVPGDLEGVGVSATGQIDAYQGKVIGSAGHIKNWEGSEIKKELERKYGLHTTVINDANAVAIGEKWVGSAKDFSNAIVITIGTGIGGGVIINSEILLGHRGIAGELGHFSINDTGKTCTCGNTGCYERYASMKALVEQVREDAGILEELGIKPSNIDGRLIFSLLEQGNAQIEDVINEWIGHIASGLVSLTHIFNPEAILIGGGVSVQEDLFISKVREKVLANVMVAFRENLRIEAASLGNNAGIVGAVYYCMKY